MVAELRHSSLGVSRVVAVLSVLQLVVKAEQTAILLLLLPLFLWGVARDETTSMTCYGRIRWIAPIPTRLLGEEAAGPWVLKMDMWSRGWTAEISDGTATARLTKPHFAMAAGAQQAQDGVLRQVL